MSDLIDRQAVIDAMAEIQGRATTKAELEGISKVWTKIAELPKVEPKWKTGTWRHYERMLTCSECGTEYYGEIMDYCGDDVPHYCPNCGAEMIGKANDGRDQND